ncbi:hypothetical protein SAMN04488128_10660 [Chitinophaga eiseniae]|uniref:Uncharacterized protein n=1 Tax=Chitinophaga eiseniae TaxID=634771 RepID=A0A1T4TR52_9BACT|nr:hypothetical protein [Chitinophaga eiseniae]SKA42945.1 hypothetical protein SAMN04488128_10660 [Chitinophaga eiseniae]
MRRLASLLILLPAMAFFSCNHSSSAAKEPVADSVKTVAFDFKGWLKHLKTIPHPVHGYDLESIDSALGPFAQSGFASVSAGIVARQQNYLAIAAQGFYKKDSDSSVMLLLIYSPDGKEIGRQEVGMSKEETRGDESNSIHKWPEFLNDSTFWVKETWYTLKKGATNGESKARIKQYRISYQGQINAVPQETVPFDTYAGRFKTLATPFTATYSLTGLQPVSLLTPYFDFSDLIYFEQIKLFHYGKIPVPGKGMYLLYAVGSLEGGESVMDSTVQLVYHTTDGKESSSIRLNGYIGSEGYYSASKNAVVAADGTIRVTEESNDEDGVGGEVGFIFKSEELAVYTPEAGGKFKRELAGKNFNSAEFNPADMKELLATRRSNYDAASLDTEFEQSLFSVLRDETIYVRMHVYDNGGEQLVEIYTVGTDLRVLDRYVVYNNLKKTPYEKVSARDNVSVDGEIERDDTVHKLPVNGPVTITLKDKVLLITPEGKFQAQ